MKRVVDRKTGKVRKIVKKKSELTKRDKEDIVLDRQKGMVAFYLFNEPTK